MGAERYTDLYRRNYLTVLKKSRKKETCRELAAKCGMTHVTISSVFRGKATNPTTVRKVALALGVKMKDIMK